MKKGCILELGCRWKENWTQLGHSSFCPLSGLNLSACWQIRCLMEGGGEVHGGRVRIVRPRVWSLRLSGDLPQEVTLQCPKALGAPSGGCVTPADAPPDAL